MDGLEVEDISPALEVTEDFLHCIDCPVENGRQQQQQQQHDNCSIQEVPELTGQKGFISKPGTTHAVELRNSSLRSHGGTFWGLLSKEQLNQGRDAATNNLEWAEKKELPSFNIFSMCQGRRSRSRARSTNDLAGQAKESAAFRRGHNRSRSDANYKSVPDNGAPSLERNQAAVSDLQRKEAFPNILKKGYLEQREGVGSRWSSCYIELSPCELRIYNLDSSGNQQLCTAYSLSHCHSVVATDNQDAKIVDAVFFNNIRLQLRAQSRWEALEWEQKLLERILAVRPAPQEDKPTAQAPQQLSRPTALPLFTQHCQDVLKTGVLYQLTNQNNWQAFTFVLSKSHLVAFPTEGRGPVSDPLFRVAAASQRASGQPSHVTLRGKPAKNSQRSKRQSVTSSFLGILTTLAVEKGLTAQSFRCAVQALIAPPLRLTLSGPNLPVFTMEGFVPCCQRPVGLSHGRAKVCCYSGLYYCQSCHEDDVFLIPARLVHNWDTRKHKVSKQAKEFLEFVLEEPLIDIQLQNPCLYAHVDSLAAALRLRQQLKSLRAYLFSCRAGVAEDLRRR
ncbi:PKHM3 protein, partial [Polyodon spathula]|nr:PKHM3 protein [Polyodon spathula]